MKSMKDMKKRVIPNVSLRIMTCKTYKLFIYTGLQLLIIPPNFMSLLILEQIYCSKIGLKEYTESFLVNKHLIVRYLAYKSYIFTFNNA